MDNKLCLNCSEMTTKHFCANCGQKTDTHRITLKHFVMHDLLHGVWHFEKGMLFTVKQVILRPGTAVLDYIKGKRVAYYNIFYLSLLVIALNALLFHFAKTLGHGEHISNEKPSVAEAFFKSYGTAILFSVVPVLSVNTWLLFRRLKLNLAEHIIIAGANLLGMLLMVTVFLIFQILISIEWMPGFIEIFQIIALFLILLFPFWVYYDATKNNYKFFGFLWRMVAIYALILSEWILLIALTYFLLTGEKQMTFN